MTKVTKDQHGEIVRLYKSGMTLAAVGEKYGVGFERVRQIVGMYGVKSTDGGKHVAVLKAKAAKKKAKNELCLKKYGCTTEQFESVKGNFTDGPKAPLYAFLCQRRNAFERAVCWKISFWDWWCIWRESGKWEKRGRGKGKYVMCRKGDMGAYEVGNVYIGSAVQNSVEGKTLAFERGGKRGPVYRVIIAAGGRTSVANAIGVAPQYVSQVCCNGAFPASWIGKGHLKAIADMTVGAYSESDLEEMSRECGALGGAE